MASLQSQNLFLKPVVIKSTRANLNFPSNIPKAGHVSIPNTATIAQKMSSNVVDGSGAYVRHLYAAAEAAADRAEMHAIIGQQRDNWNHLLLSSINSMNLSAVVMAGVCAARPEQFLAFKVSAALLYAAAAAMMAAVNTVQPSQLAEEQRSAVRLFRQLERSVYTELAVGDPPEEDDVKEAIARVLALDRCRNCYIYFKSDRTFR